VKDVPRAAALIFLLAASIGASGGCRSRPDVIRVGYFANLSHGQAIEAVQSGELAAALAPAKLETRVFNGGPSLVEALFAGDIDVGYLGPSPALNAHARSRGEGIRVVAGAAANGVVIVARGNSDIHALADLKGKHIATPELGNTQDISARHYVIDVLKQPDADNVVPIANAEQAGMFARGEIDAAWVPEPWGEVLVEQAGARIVAEEKALWPNGRFGLSLVVASPSFVAERAEALEKILRVHHAWTQRLSSEPDKYVGSMGDGIFALTGKRIPSSVIASAMHRIEYTDDPQEETLRTYAGWSRELRMGPRSVNSDGLVDVSVLQRVTR
jgi:NitT/TauT family transport system substrate-binding protein